MLFSDSDIVTAADLLQIDSEVTAVAQASKPAIAVDGPGSICAQAWLECGRRILSAQQMYACTFVALGTTGGHQAAVNYTGGPPRNQSRARLNQIVASESQYANASSTVQIWMAYSALALFYRDASARMGKDRLQDKYDRYLADADFSWRQLRQNGLPYVDQPMDAPGSLHAVGAGTWGAGNLSAVAGSGTAQTLQVAITYYDATRYISEANKVNGESGPSALVSIVMAASTVLKVSIAGLNPPSGVMPQVGTSQGIMTPLNTTHWNVWVGVAGGPLYWQAAVPVATKTCTLASDPVVAGNILGLGQWPDLFLTMQAIVGRG